MCYFTNTKHNTETITNSNEIMESGKSDDEEDPSAMTYTKDANEDEIYTLADTVDEEELNDNDDANGEKLDDEPEESAQK